MIVILRERKATEGRVWLPSLIDVRHCHVGLPDGRGNLPDAAPTHRHVPRLHGVRDKRSVEAAVFRPQTGSYNSLEEEAAALMEPFANNHGFLDGNKRTVFTAADVFLRRNGSYIEVEAVAGCDFISRSMERHEFRFAKILDWIRQQLKPLNTTNNLE